MRNLNPNLITLLPHTLSPQPKDPTVKPEPATKSSTRTNPPHKPSNPPLEPGQSTTNRAQHTKILSLKPTKHSLSLPKTPPSTSSVPKPFTS